MLTSTMLIQYFIVSVILLAAIIYIIRRVRQTIREAESGCYGCKGCALKEQMIKNRARKGRKTKKNECFEKKVGKTFGGYKK